MSIDAKLFQLIAELKHPCEEMCSSLQEEAVALLAKILQIELDSWLPVYRSLVVIELELWKLLMSDPRHQAEYKTTHARCLQEPQYTWDGDTSIQFPAEASSVLVLVAPGLHSVPPQTPFQPNVSFSDNHMHVLTKRDYDGVKLALNQSISSMDLVLPALSYTWNKKLLHQLETCPSPNLVMVFQKKTACLSPKKFQSLLCCETVWSSQGPRIHDIQRRGVSVRSFDAATL
jgi:hypothetical protein